MLRTPKRGLGRAYIDAGSYIRGRYVVMGDADCTYDFRQLAPFVEKLHEGYEFVMGSRWLGTIEEGAMPATAQICRHTPHNLDLKSSVRQSISPISTAACVPSLKTLYNAWASPHSRGSTHRKWFSSPY